MILFKPSFVERLVWCVVWKGSNRTCWSSDLFGFPRRYYENVNVLWARKCYHTNTVWWLTFKIIWFKNISLLSSPHWLGDWRHVEECVPLKNIYDATQLESRDQSEPSETITILTNHTCSRRALGRLQQLLMLHHQEVSVSKHEKFWVNVSKSGSECVPTQLIKLHILVIKLFLLSVNT